MSKEIRNGNLIATIKTNLPTVGFVHIDTKSAGRKATFRWRCTDFVASSRLIVKEIGIFGNTDETEDSIILTERLKGTNAIA